MTDNFIHKQINKHFQNCKNNLELFNEEASKHIFLIQVISSYYSMFESELKTILKLDEIMTILKRNNILTKSKMTYIPVLRIFLGWYIDNQEKSYEILEDFELEIETKYNSIYSISWSTFYQQYINNSRNEIVHDFCLPSILKTEEKVEWFIPRFLDFFSCAKKILKEAQKLR